MKWVNIEDRLPEERKRVLVLTHTRLMEVGYLLGGCWERNWAGTSFKEAGYEITHWRPLPAPPIINKQTGREKTSSNDNPEDYQHTRFGNNI